MTIKSSRKKSGSRAAKATNRKNSKATAPKQPGITKLARKKGASRRNR